MIDRAALCAIAARAVARKEIQEAGYRALAKSSDLFRVGYSINYWFLVSEGKVLLEYNPRLSDLPRLTATCYAEQVAIHLALGLNLVPPDEQWVDDKQPGLFDGHFAQMGGSDEDC